MKDEKKEVLKDADLKDLESSEDVKFFLNEIDDSEGYFKIRDIPETVSRKIEKKSRTKRPGSANFLDFHDGDGMTRKKIEYALTDFGNIPREKMVDLLDHNADHEYMEQLRKEGDVVNYSAFWKNQFVKNSSTDFLSFFNAGLDDIVTAKKDLLKASLKN